MSRAAARHLALVGFLLLLIVAAGAPDSAYADSPFADLWDVSCGAPGSCAAVGTDDTNALLFTETNGASEAGTDAPLPANAASTPYADLYSVSCASAGNCTAVGAYGVSTGSYQGLLLTETNGSWATGTEAPLPANATPRVSQFVRLLSVSCASAGNCTAVGSYTDNASASQGLLLTETNGTWAAGTEAPLPANATHSRRQFVQLSSVSCPSAGNCTAIGTYTDNSRNTWGLLLSERNGAWATGTEARLPGDAAADALVNPSGHFNFGLNGVTCASAGNCTAIGEYANTAGFEQGVLLTERNGHWARGVEARLPANAATTRRTKAYVLFSLSCTSAGNCLAVGWYTDRAGDGDPLLVTERNGTWRRGVEARLPANASKRRFQTADDLESVSCPSVGNCTAVGSYWTRSKMEGLLLSETNGRWTATEAHLPAGGTQATFVVSDERPALSGVSCASAGTCSAIGTYADSGSQAHGMLLTETGGGWARGVETTVP